MNKKIFLLSAASILFLFFLSSEAAAANSTTTNCTTGWYTTGYATPAESDFSGSTQTITLKNIKDSSTTQLTFIKSFLDQVKIDGWGKTKSSNYIGYWSGQFWGPSSYPTDSLGNKLAINIVAVDPSVISYGKSLTIPTLPSPWKNRTFIANDTGPGITGKHIDIYTGEGQSARDETFKVTNLNSTVCIIGFANSSATSTNTSTNVTKTSNSTKTNTTAKVNVTNNSTKPANNTVTVIDRPANNSPPASSPPSGGGGGSPPITTYPIQNAASNDNTSLNNPPKPIIGLKEIVQSDSQNISNDLKTVRSEITNSSKNAVTGLFFAESATPAILLVGILVFVAGAIVAHWLLGRRKAEKLVYPPSL